MADKAPEEESSPPPNRDLLKDLSRIAMVLAVFIGFGVLVAYSPYARDVSSLSDVMALGLKIREALHPDDSIKDQLISYLIYCSVGALLIGIGLPRWIVAVVGGSLYGAFLGTVMASIASQVGATGTYMIGSSLLKSTIKRRFGKRFQVIRERFVANGFGYTLQLRLFPGTPATLTSVLCGACRVKMRSYQLANLVGFLPQTIIFALIGSGTTKGENWQIYVGITLFVLFSLGHYVVRHVLKKRNEAKALLEEEDDDQATALRP